MTELTDRILISEGEADFDNTYPHYIGSSARPAFGTTHPDAFQTGFKRAQYAQLDRALRSMTDQQLSEIGIKRKDIAAYAKRAMGAM